MSLTYEYEIVNVATDSTTVVPNGPVVLGGIIVTTALSAHALPIEDANGNTVAAVAASSAVGTHIGFGNGILIKNGLVVDPDNAATGQITVYYRRGGQ